MASADQILLIEDDSGLASALSEILLAEGYTVTVQKRGDLGLAQAQQTTFNLVVTDLKLPGLSGLELVRQLHRAQPRLPIILMTAHGTTETAIEAMQYGAYDYLLKPFDMGEFLELVCKTLEHSRLMLEPVSLGVPDASCATIIGQSRAMQAIYKEIGRIAVKPVTVLLRGETGTGKEMIARAIYQHSDRHHSPFVALNCSAIPDTLLESELFGHERGAFTGADSRRIGRFEQADHGTVFLDEIGDMSLLAQAKLLRVLQEKCLQRVGGKETIPVDVRVIAATNQDLETALRQGTFREDLYYRLSVAVITLPPLRDRREDIPELVNYFLQKYGAEMGVSKPAIHPEALQILQTQSWPGNVRELENVMRQVLILAGGYCILPDHIHAAIRKLTGLAKPVSDSLSDYVSELLANAQSGAVPDPYTQLLETAERELFRQVIHLARGNQARAARLIGVSRLTMQRKLLHFGLHPNGQSVPETMNSTVQ